MLNFAKGLQDYFSILYLKCCTKLGVEPNILPVFKSNVVGFLVFLSPSKPHCYLRDFTWQADWNFYLQYC